MRTQSMSHADNTFNKRMGRPQRRNGVEITEMENYSDQENQERKYKTLDKAELRARNQEEEMRKYRTIDPRMPKQEESGVNYSCHSLERGVMRRRLPDVPLPPEANVGYAVKSLPRNLAKSKREQSDSRTRGIEGEEDKSKRSKSHGDELEVL